MIEKYPIESDFTESYLNLFLLNNFFRQPDNYSVISDAAVFNSCVHLNPAALNLANCSDRRDNVDRFISRHQEQFSRYVNVVKDSCKDELVSAHAAELQMERDLTKVPSSEVNFLTLMRRQTEQNLMNCVNKNL